MPSKQKKKNHKQPICCQFLSCDAHTHKTHTRTHSFTGSCTQTLKLGTKSIVTQHCRFFLVLIIIEGELGLHTVPHVSYERPPASDISLFVSSISLTHTHAHTPFLQLHTLSHARNVKTAQIAEGWPGPLGPRQAHTLSLGYRYARPTYAADAMGSVCKDLLTLREDLLTLREDLPTFREDQSVC